ncbi:flagellar basal body-associated FliL family protein [Falsiphaeobacter marinintestinus]|uniref:flagellar basal body-associated FliL family protein n=1 Tax=Falsiphaeobacter marinintestinus TaxID=1492905 RepID=UPI0011B3866C|nr:flagellar basal body-associated FliL family protein [Phaeobacter marinintestinus]
MLSKLLPLLFLTLGIGAGVGAGIFLSPPPEENADSDHEPDQHQQKTHSKDGHDDKGGTEFIKLHSQFVVPIIRHDEVSALVVMSLSLEAQPGLSEVFYAREPKLRDVFLQTLFDHANMGGFDGAFTSASALDPLRGALRDVARKELGDDVINVLITDLARQNT